VSIKLASIMQRSANKKVMVSNLLYKIGIWGETSISLLVNDICNIMSICSYSYKNIKKLII